MLKFNEKIFFHTKLGFTKTDDTGEKPTKITGTDKIHWKCDFIDGSLVCGIRQPTIKSFALDSPLVKS